MPSPTKALNSSDLPAHQSGSGVPGSSASPSGRPFPSWRFTDSPVPSTSNRPKSPGIEGSSFLAPSFHGGASKDSYTSKWLKDTGRGSDGRPLSPTARLRQVRTAEATTWRRPLGVSLWGVEWGRGSGPKKAPYKSQWQESHPLSSEAISGVLLRFTGETPLGAEIS